MATMQYDVFATKPLTATGNFKDQNNFDINRTRIKTIYAVNGASAGSVVIREGGSGGNIVLTVDTAASGTAGYTIIPLPGEGILVKTGTMHGTVTNTTSMVLFYG
jgi:glyoxylase-like metal-dependent hydrolase (beta-lactamase superfamily II)